MLPQPLHVAKAHPKAERGSKAPGGDLFEDSVELKDASAMEKTRNVL